MTKIEERRKQAQGKALLFGVASVALYALAFSFSQTMVTLFARGGAYCLLPVATVFLISYVHGNFASYTWTALGIEASAKAGRKTAQPAARRTTDTRGRASMTA